MKKLIKILIVISFFAVNFNLYANNITINSSTNWSAVIGGSGTGGLPGSADAITVQNGATLTVNVTNGTCKSIQLGGFLSAGTLTFNLNSQITVSGAVTMGAATGNGQIVMTSGGKLICASITSNNIFDSFTEGTGTVQFTGTFNLGGTDAANILGSFNNLEINGGTVTIAKNETISGYLNVLSGTFSTGTSAFTLSVTGTTSVTGTLMLGGTGTKTFTGDVTFNLGGVWNETGVAAINFAGSLTNNATTFTTNTGTHTFSGATKILSGATTTSIPTAAFSGSYTNSGILTVSTALSGTGSITNTGTLNIGGTSSITTLANAGTTTISGSGAISTILANFTNTGTLNLNGSGTITGITNNAAGLVNLTNSGTITNFNNATSTSTLNISDNTVPTITTLTATTVGNTVNYSGASQIVKATTYYNLTLSGSLAKTISGSTVNGTLSIEGTAITAGTSPGFGASSILQYKGTALQTPSSVEFPSSSGPNSLTINNSNDVSFPASFSRTIAGTLTLTNGALSIGSNTLTINNAISTSSGSLTGGSTSNIIIGDAGAAANTTLPAVNLNNLTLNRANGLTLGGAVTVSGTLTLTNGALSIGNNTLTINNSIVTTSGSLTGGSTSNIIIGDAGSAANTTLPAVNLNNLTLNRANGLTLGGAVTINGAYTPTAGALSLSGKTLTLAGTMGTIGTGTIIGSSTSSLIINGSGNMTLPSISAGLSSFTLNMGNNSSILTLSSNVTIYNTLTFSTTSGNINTGTNTLTLGDVSTNSGTFSNSAGSSTGVITGKFARYITAGNVSALNFPVGDVTSNSAPRTVTIQYSSGPATPGTLTAQYITGDPGFNSTGTLTDAGYTVNTYSHIGYWQMTAGTLSGGTYNITISPVGFTGMSVYANLRVLKRTLSTDPWALPGNQVNGTSAPTAGRSSLSGFSQFALGGNTIDNPLDGPLPVELTTFSANTIDRDVKLNWITATEQNNSGFELQRQNSVSNNQYSNWEKIGFIKGSGTKSTPTNYSYNDTKLNTGKYKYRLKQIDYNGNFEYFNLNSEIIIGTPNKFDISQNYPNPFNPTTKIDYNLPFESQVSIKVYDISGREVKTLVNETKQAGYYTVDFSGNDFASGMYFYRITAENNGQKIVMMKKMLMIK